ncbi:MAG TPA: sigma-54 dependent transcriptional regulator [Bacteriovoracaceae bacterium]|nr:sigma-54 dependent transcriptional regulator [Bacteriovoracaceae bacterium]
MKRIPKILVLDDDHNWLSQIPLILEDDYEITTLATIDEGIQAVQTHFYDVILLDMNFGNDPRSGIDVFRMIKAKDHSADVIVISGETRPDRLVQIMNAGVTKFLPKPCTPDQIRSAIHHALEVKEIKLRSLNILKSKMPDKQLIGRSILMQKLREEISHAVKAGIKDILLTGETGTGKEVIAKIIAYQSDPNFRFSPIHCGAISDGVAESELFGHVKGAFTGADRDRPSVFEVVGGGFVFLDEIGDMPLSHQAKLLRVIQERQIQRVGSSDIRDVNFRSISATHIDLEAAITKKTFREDLYYRIAKAVIRVPSLRERSEDIIELTHHFMIEAFPGRGLTITEDALELLMAYHWPGNVRQLRGAIESIGSRNTDDVVRESDICQALPQIASVFGNRTSKLLVGRYGASLINKERERFEKALLATRGNKCKAANQMGMSRATFYRRASELGLIQARENG